MKRMIIIAVAGALVVIGGLGLLFAANYAERTSNGELAAAGACPHGIEAERCPFCTPALIESLGWCGGHDVAEALCTRCNAALIPAFQATGDWCAEHGLPESQCALCGGGGGGASGGSVVPAALTRETPPSDGMRAQRPPSETCINAFSTVQLASPEVARRAGIEVVPLQALTIDETVRCNAEVAFDGDRYAQLASRASGIIAEVRADLGEHVEAGAVLALVDSAELGSAKAACLQARMLVTLWERNAARERTLFEKNFGTEKDLLEAETSLAEHRVQLLSAEQRLRNLGLSIEDIARLMEEGDTSSMLPLRAPFAGTIVERNAVVGEVISTGLPIFALADTSAMWVMLDVYESDVARLRPGQSVAVTMEGIGAEPFLGDLTWISAQVDPRTRTLRARAEVSNPDGLLRANMFGHAEVHVATIENALLVPHEAVQWDGCCNLVFVRQTPTVFQPYKVTLGARRDGHYILEEGLFAGDEVVTEGSFLLKTEILKGNIGAGCCEVDPGATRSEE